MNCSEKEGDRSSDSKLVAMGYRTNMHYYVICLIISGGVMESHICIYRPMVRWGVAKAASLQIVCAQLEKAPIHPSHCASAYVAFTSPALYFWCHLKMPLGQLKSISISFMMLWVDYPAGKDIGVSPVIFWRFQGCFNLMQKIFIRGPAMG